MGLNLFRILMIYLKPILPVMVEKAENFLNIKPLQWSDLNKSLTNHRINQFVPLMQRIETEKIEKADSTDPLCQLSDEGSNTIT